MLLPDIPTSEHTYERTRFVQANRIEQVVDHVTYFLLVLEGGEKLMRCRGWVLDHQPKPGMVLVHDEAEIQVWPWHLFKTVHRRVVV